jgi:hypothetical protein
MIGATFTRIVGFRTALFVAPVKRGPDISEAMVQENIREGARRKPGPRTCYAPTMSSTATRLNKVIMDDPIYSTNTNGVDPGAFTEVGTQHLDTATLGGST